MEIKHQIFVSSTFKDLIDERKEVIHALLELDCIPAGMELFPAADEDAWSLIKEIIDGCDYYVLILAGKYGSTNDSGIGYTEMEFDYAVSKGKPIICFLHENIENLPASKVESSDTGKAKLMEFRKKAESKHCKYWSTPHELGGKVSRSLIKLKKRHPSPGWVPGIYATDPNLLTELETLRKKVAEFEYQNLKSKDNPPSNFDELVSGNDFYTANIRLKTQDSTTKKRIPIKCTWDKLFSYCGAALTGECTTEEMNTKMKLAFWHSIPDEIRKENEYDKFTLAYVTQDQIRIQFQALGLIVTGEKKRAVSDTNTYWTLTPFGEKYLIQIRAIRKN